MTGIGQYFPAVLVDDRRKAAAFWAPKASLHIDRWKNLGRYATVDLGYPALSWEEPIPWYSEAPVMAILGDYTLSAKRRELWGDEPFEFVAPVESLVPERWDLQPLEPIVDIWGNSVSFR